METTPYDQVIQTAWPVAYDRTFTDIPYSQEIFDALLAVRQQERNDLFDESQIRTALAPQFEARHKLLTRLIQQSEVRQVLEIAAGLTARGLIMTANADMEYVETDLPKMAEEKEKIIQILEERNALPHRPNLHIETANALDFGSLENAARFFARKPIAVVHEGLLRYLNFDEKARVAKNIHDLLVRFGGVWITCDISMKKIIAQEDPRADQRISKMSALTGRDIGKNLFENIEHARSFFEELGFFVQQHNLAEVADELVSPQRLGLTNEQVHEVVDPVVVFAMKIS